METVDIYHSEEEIDKLVERFQIRTLEKEKWTHFAHLTTGLYFLKTHDQHDATCRIKSGIVAYNIAVGGENTGNSGYHETMTIFWMEVLHFFVNEFPEDTLLELSKRFLTSPLADKKLPMDFYDAETLMSPLYRSRYIAPDKQSLSEGVLRSYLSHN